MNVDGSDYFLSHYTPKGMKQVTVLILQDKLGEGSSSALQQLLIHDEKYWHMYISGAVKRHT